ncbi:MAG: restriction endonuclease subunit S [Gemmatimonadota bacterium]|nr:restriction endonuclease subunit S [Gemmatimonadota bacterium]
MAWPRVRLGDVVSLEYGKSLPADLRDPRGKFPVAGSNGPHGQHTSAFVSSPGIVVGRKGSAGRVIWYDEDFWPIDTTYYVVPKISLDMRWTYFMLSHLQLNQLATTTGVPGLNRNDVYNLGIYLPPLAEQRRIVDILDQADRLRRLRDEADANAARILPALFIKMFGDPGNNPRKLPTVELATVVIKGPQNGLYKPASSYGGGTKILRIDGFYAGEVSNLDTLKRLKASPEEIAKYGLEKSDIVVNRVNSEEYLGKSAIIPALSEPVVFESNMMRFTVDTLQILPEFVVAHLQTSFTRAEMLSKAKRAINQPSINQQDVRSLTILLPSLADQKRFIIASNKVRTLVFRFETERVKLKRLFDVLIHRAVSGTLSGSLQ